jgi:RNA polymerase sigma-70 factor (ECF subfamily)
MKRRKGKFEPTREISLDEAGPDGPNGVAREIEDTSSLPEEAAARNELRKAVQETILSLPHHYRIVLVLRDMEQLSTSETAEALDLPVSTIKMRLHRGRLMLRKELVERFGEQVLSEAG